jgi:hypothetical protein
MVRSGADQHPRTFISILCTLERPLSTLFRAISSAMSHRRSRVTETFQPAAAQQRRKWTTDEDDYLRGHVERFRMIFPWE